MSKQNFSLSLKDLIKWIVIIAVIVCVVMLMVKVYVPAVPEVEASRNTTAETIVCANCIPTLKFLPASVQLGAAANGY